MAKKQTNKKNEIIDVTPEVVSEAKELAIIEERERLARIDKSRTELARIREVKAIEARLKDMEYIEKLDKVGESILEVLLEDDRLIKHMKKALDGGNAKQLQHILVSLGVTLDKREKLLGYDEERAKQGLGAKKTKFQVVFRGPDGAQAGVSVETNE